MFPIWFFIDEFDESGERLQFFRTKRNVNSGESFLNKQKLVIIIITVNVQTRLVVYHSVLVL